MRMRERSPQEITQTKMADMEETGQTTTGFEEDPAAAFLAREQDELADIAGETLGLGAGDSEVSWGGRRERTVDFAVITTSFLPHTDGPGASDAAAGPRRISERRHWPGGEKRRNLSFQ